MCRAKEARTQRKMKTGITVRPPETNSCKTTRNSSRITLSSTNWSRNFAIQFSSRVFADAGVVYELVVGPDVHTRSGDCRGLRSRHKLLTEFAILWSGKICFSKTRIFALKKMVYDGIISLCFLSSRALARKGTTMFEADSKTLRRAWSSAIDQSGSGCHKIRWAWQ